MSAAPAVLRVVHELEARACKPRWTGKAFAARCPAHDDRVASLAVREGDDGRVLLCCHAGCETERVVEALGLTMRDLFPETNGAASRETRYAVRDAGGVLVATHVRWDRPGGKEVRWWRDGKWGLDSLPTSDVPLYGAHLVGGWATDSVIVVTEGEKAADALTARGIPALGTVTGAAGTPGLAALEVLRGRQVVLWPDHDAPGAAHMHRVAAALAEIAASVRWIAWGSQPGDDAADFKGSNDVLRELVNNTTAPPDSESRDASGRGPAASVEAAQSRSPRQGREIVLRDPEPWPEPVGGEALADDVIQALRRFLILPAHAAETVTLWLLHAHAHDVAHVSPIFVATSPTKRCGKSTLLHLLSALVPRPLMTSNVTPAALFRAVEKYRPSLLVDECDSFLTLSDEMRGLLNSGHTRAGAVVIRTVGKDFEARAFTTWCPKALAVIGRLPDTVEDRSVIVPMRRKKAGDRVERLRLDRLADFEPLRRRAARWAADYVEALRAADPDVPSELHDRSADNWRPLLAVADLLGPEWAARARKAALGLAGLAPDTANGGEMLLADLAKLFAEQGVNLTEQGASLTTATILDELPKLDGRPWAEAAKGRPITSTVLASLLGAFGIKSRNLKIDGKVLKGYTRSDCDDAFSRYLSAATPLPPAPTAAEPESSKPLPPPSVAAAENEVLTSNDAPGSSVASANPGNPEPASPTDGGTLHSGPPDAPLELAFPEASA